MLLITLDVAVHDDVLVEEGEPLQHLYRMLIYRWVLTLDVAVHDDVLVQKREPLQHLGRVLARQRLQQGTVLLQVVSHRTLGMNDHNLFFITNKEKENEIWGRGAKIELLFITKKEKERYGNINCIPDR